MLIQSYHGQTMLSFLFLSLSAGAEEPVSSTYLNNIERPVRFEATWEVGSLAVFGHTYQSGKSATEFDFVEDGGQDNLFPYQRFEVNFLLNRRHSFLLLYQPLNLRTTQEASSDIVMNNTTFPTRECLQVRPSFLLSFISLVNQTGKGGSL